VLWRKLSFLGPLALLTSVARGPIGEAISSRGDLVRPLVEEAAAAAGRAGVAIDADGNVSRLQSLPQGMQSSMLKDLLAGRAAELDAIAGPILRALGREGAPATVEAVSLIGAASG
jgi:2-dehydropantoate 2-reductase